MTTTSIDALAPAARPTRSVRPRVASDDFAKRAYLPTTETRDLPADTIAHPELDPDHHLWKNGTRWWIAITIHTADWRVKRVRKSLGTADIREARVRRDSILRFFQHSNEYELSLRYARLLA